MERNAMFEQCINKFKLCGLRQLSSLYESTQSHIMSTYFSEEDDPSRVFVTLVPKSRIVTGVFIVDHWFKYIYLEVRYIMYIKQLKPLVEQLRGRFRSVDCIVLKAPDGTGNGLLPLFKGIPIFQPSSDTLFLFKWYGPKAVDRNKVVEIPGCMLEFRTKDLVLWRHSHTQYISNNDKGDMVYITFDPPVVYPWWIEINTYLNTELKAPLVMDAPKAPNPLPRWKALIYQYHQQSRVYGVLLPNNEDYLVRRFMAIPKKPSKHPDIAGFQEYIAALAKDSKI